MRTLTDEALISAYVTAVSLQLEGEFIELLRKELIQRGLQDRDVEQWCKARA
ncbi:MAG TPA: sporulation histidine kinase inhibitor Sda [Paenibacillus sp.]|nr:sporulation histidine kinase inhibitor Sda [Paenibacillus sp.]